MRSVSIGHTQTHASVYKHKHRHGYINFGVAPLLLNEPLSNKGDRKSVVIIGAGLAGKVGWLAVCEIVCMYASTI